MEGNIGNDFPWLLLGSNEAKGWSVLSFIWWDSNISTVSHAATAHKIGGIICSPPVDYLNSLTRVEDH